MERSAIVVLPRKREDAGRACSLPSLTINPVSYTHLGQPQDIRLVVADMDGTLLDERSRIPDGFWPMLARLKRRGVEFVPASGRQYACLLYTSRCV